MRLLLVSAALVALPAVAQTSAPPASVSGPPTLGAHATTASVDVDGVLDEAAWADADAATDFVQFRPDVGAPASERTEARVLYDGGAVYVGMRMYDAEPDAIEARSAAATPTSPATGPWSRSTRTPTRGRPSCSPSTRPASSATC